jgi:hypothetical protein
MPDPEPRQGERSRPVRSSQSRSMPLIMGASAVSKDPTEAGSSVLLIRHASPRSATWDVSNPFRRVRDYRVGRFGRVSCNSRRWSNRLQDSTHLYLPGLLPLQRVQQFRLQAVKPSPRCPTGRKSFEKSQTITLKVWKYFRVKSKYSHVSSFIYSLAEITSLRTCSANTADAALILEAPAACRRHFA